MSMKISSHEIIEILQRNEVSVFQGTTDSLDIEFISSSDQQLTDFITFLVQNRIHNAFLKINRLTRSEIADSLVSEHLMEQKLLGVPEIYRKMLRQEAEAFNSRQQKLTRHIGKEIFIKVFAAHQGLIIGYEWVTDDFSLADPEDFINDWLEQHEEEIWKVREEEQEKRNQQQQRKLDELEQELLRNEEFRNCTNINMRKDFLMGLIVERDDDLFENLRMNQIYERVERAWRAIKYKRA